MKRFLSERMQGIERTLIRQIHDRADPSCINLGLGELSFPTPEPILDCLRRKVKNWKLSYTPNEGLLELRKLVADKSGLPVAWDQVCITAGAEEALFLALMVIVSPGDEVLIPDPGFPAYGSIVRIAGGVPTCYPLCRENNFSLRREDVEKIITEKTKAIMVNSPNNPSGAVYSSDELRSLAGLLEKHRIIAVSDEVYRDIYFEKQPDSIARYLEKTLVINSLSKSFSMTGWRLGWCIAPSELIHPIIDLHQLVVTCAPAISQQAALLALKGIAEEQKQLNVEELKKRRNLAMSCLAEYTSFDFVKPSGAFYIFVDVSSRMSKYGSSLEISLDLLSKEKVVTIPGLAFGERGEGYLRLSFALPPDQIEEGIRRIGRYLR